MEILETYKLMINWIDPVQCHICRGKGTYVCFDCDDYDHKEIINHSEHCYDCDGSGTLTLNEVPIGDVSILYKWCVDRADVTAQITETRMDRKVTYTTTLYQRDIEPRNAVLGTMYLQWSANSKIDVMKMAIRNLVCHYPDKFR